MEVKSSTVDVPRQVLVLQSKGEDQFKQLQALEQGFLAARGQLTQ